MQASRKVRFEVGGSGGFGDGEEEQRTRAQESIVAPSPSYGPGRAGCGGWWDPMNLYAEFSTGNPDVEAFMKVKCVKGSSCRPCYYSKITCANINLGGYNNPLLQFFAGMAQNSILKQVTIKKPTDGASPTLMRFQGISQDIETIEIIFVRKVPADWIQETESRDYEGGQDELGGGRIGRHCGRPCFNRCNRCVDGGSGIWSQDWQRYFPFRQATLRYKLYCARIVAFNQVAGEQCKSKPVGAGDCGGSCSGYPSSLNPGTWGGSPGITAGAGWHVTGEGQNFPDRPRYHHFGSLSDDQINIQFSSMVTRVEILNPMTGCYSTKDEEVYPS